MRIPATRWGCYALGWVLICGAWPAAAWAVDAITLMSGLIIEGDITVETEQRVKIRVKGRVMQFPRGSIASIEYGPESTAPSQIQKREDESKEDLKEAQEKVKTLKFKKKKKKKKKKQKKEDDATTVTAAIATDGSLIIPAKPTAEEEKWIKELRTGKNKIGACKALAKLRSTIALPVIIRALDDSGVFVRRAANDALRTISAQDFGFKHDERKRSLRVEAIRRWQKWYEKASGKKVSW